MRVCFLFIFFWGIYLSVVAQNHTGKNYGLFFANSDYSTNADFNNLRNPIKDARAIADELKEMYGFETKVYENYTRTQIYRVLEQWQ